MADEDNRTVRDIFSDLSGAMSDPDPVKRAQIQMQKPLPKRFYKEAGVAAQEEGRYGVVLDGRPVRTPGRNLLAYPSEALAVRAAEEWASQGEAIDPATMPLTRLANTALDGVASDMQAVAEDVLRFAGTDLICYRAGDPERLVARQAETWDSVIDWAAGTLGARFLLAEGVMHVAQPREAIAAFSVHVAGFDDPLALAALHVATALTGSAILAMALAKGAHSPDEIWAMAHLDEMWNEELWGQDHEALKRRAARRRDFDAAALVLDDAASR
ncbi:ATP12 family chaperone protein [Pararhizobium haloflavum]|uniref:ATP12 family chaperone protein n=1 Tax=Pararhizobium haloflavum TaxID=2037914 RepID=UPI000C18EFAB|nr:ATP12 family protein [Pararhizobium haloflavum]